MNSLKCKVGNALRIFSGFAAIGFLPAMAGDNPLNLQNALNLRVDVADAQGECPDFTGAPQRVTAHASLSGGSGDCPVTLAITVEAKVEVQNAAFDFVYVNDVLFLSGIEDPKDCENTSMRKLTVTKEVTVSPAEGLTLLYDTSDERYHTGAYAVITNIVQIGGGCEAGCTAGGGSLDNGSVHVALSLGRTDLGKSAGALRIEEQLPSATLGTPASLRYASAWQGVQLIQNGSDVRQVRAPQCLADVVTETPQKFRVDFYDNANIGTFNGTVFNQAGKTSYVSWVFENLDPVNNDHLMVTQVKGAVSVVNEFIWDPASQGWELREGDGQRKEKKTVVVDTVAQTRTVTTEVRNAADQLVSKEVNVYKDFPWGRELLSTVVDPDGAALTTTRVYYDNSATDGGAYGKLKSVTRSDGGWARYEYDAQGRRTKTVEPFLDAPFGSAESACKVTTVSYSVAAPQETRIVTILGQEVERSYEVNSGDFTHTSQEIVCTVPGATHTAASNLVTVTKLVNTGPFTGEVESTPTARTTTRNPPSRRSSSPKVPSAAGRSWTEPRPPPLPMSQATWSRKWSSMWPAA